VSVPTANSSALHTMSRGRRRALVLVMQVGMAAFALALAFRGADLSWVLILSVCSQLLYVVIFFRVLRPVMSEIIKKQPDLDERELSLRNQAHYSAYQILVVVLTTVITAPMAASLYFGLDLPLRVTQWHFLAQFFLFANLSISLPASVVAWTEPDPRPEEP
jgi:MFS family permease